MDTSNKIFKKKKKCDSHHQEITSELKTKRKKNTK